GAGRGRPRQTVGANQGGDDGMERLRQGLVLVIVGIVLYFLVREQGSGSGGVILALIGSAFMVFYALTNQSGYLVPGGLMTGLGIGIDWPHAWWPSFQGSTVLVGLGLGRLVVWVGIRRGVGHGSLYDGLCLCRGGVRARSVDSTCTNARRHAVLACII